MSIDLGELFYFIRAKTDKLQPDLDQSEQQVQKFGDNVSGHLSNAMDTALGVVMGQGFQNLANKVGEWGDSLVDAGADVESIMSKFDQALVNSGHETDGLRDKLLDYASKFEAATFFDGDDILAAEGRLTRFTNISTEKYEQILQSSADMAAQTGSDIGATIDAVGMMLANPGRAAMQLRKYGIILDTEQQKMLAGWVKNGDMASAQNFLLDQLSGKYAGAAAKALDTYEGKMKKAQVAQDNLKESLGAAVLPAQEAWVGFMSDKVYPIIGKLIDGFTKLPGPIQNLVVVLGMMFVGVAKAAPTLAPLVGAFNMLAGAGGIGGVTTAISGFIGTAIPAIGTFVTTAIGGIGSFMAAALPAIGSLIAAAAPILIPLGLIVAAVLLLKLAWDNNFLGMRDTLTAFWNDTLKPVFDSLGQWLSDLLPKALAFLSDTWNNVLLPAIQAVGNFINGILLPVLKAVANFVGAIFVANVTALSVVWNQVLLPILQTVYKWMQTYLYPFLQLLGELVGAILAVAVAALAAVWRDVLLPAIQNVYNWLNGTLMPFLQSIVTFFTGVFKAAVEGAGKIWTETLLPALQTVYKFLKDTFQPIFESIGKFIEEKFLPTMRGIADFFNNTLLAAFNGICNVIKDLIGWLKDLADGFNKVKTPPDLTPGSPTPFELGLRGINKALEDMNKITMPALIQNLQAEIPSTMISQDNSRRNTYYLTAQYASQEERSLLNDIQHLQILDQMA